MWFLERLIRRKFDPRRVDAAKGRPEWMQRLLVSDRGRAVLFSLAEAHPNCLLITIAIQHAWQHGHADEVRALGPAAASYFSIFHELLAEHFTALIAAGDDEDRRAGAIDVIKRACTQSLATYLFAQMMLADLARGGDAGLAGGGSSKAVSALASRVSRELEAAAAATHEVLDGAQDRAPPRGVRRGRRRDRGRGDLLLTTEEERRRRGIEGNAAGVAPPLPRGILKKLHALYPDRPLRGTPSLRRRAWVRPPGWRLRVRTRTRARARRESASSARAPPVPLRRGFRCNVGAAASADPGRAESRAQCVDLIVRGLSTAGKTRWRRRDGRWRARRARSRRRLEGRRRSRDAFAIWSGTRPRRLA